MKFQTIRRRFVQRTRHLMSLSVATSIVVFVNGDALAQLNQRTISNDGQEFRVVTAAMVDIPTAADARPKSPVQQTGVQQPPVQQTGVQQTGVQQSPVQQAGVQSAGVQQAGVQQAGGNQDERFGPIGSAIHHTSPIQQVGCASMGSACDAFQPEMPCSSGGCASMGNIQTYAPLTCNGCQPYSYVRAEALGMKRRGDRRFTLADDFQMDGFDMEWGSRFTFGTLPDCVNGCELTLVTPIKWTMQGSRVDPSAGINTILSTQAPLATSDLSAFHNATGQAQKYKAEYWSVEANKTIVGWDSAKLLYGVRYIDYEEDYGYTSRNNAGQVGAILNSTENRMLGGQIGLDMLYPVAQHMFADVRTRTGVFVDFAESDMGIYNDGSTIVRNRDHDQEIAGVFELGAGLRYNLGEALSVRGGMEMWYLAGVASVPDQFQNRVVAQQLGRSVDVDNDILFYGLSVGAELRF